MEMQALIVVERDALIQALIELEHQEEIQKIILSAYVERLKVLSRLMEEALMNGHALSAKQALQALLLPDSELNNIFPDEQLEEWQAEAQVRLSCCETEPPTLGIP